MPRFIVVRENSACGYQPILAWRICSASQSEGGVEGRVAGGREFEIERQRGGGAPGESRAGSFWTGPVRWRRRRSRPPRSGAFWRVVGLRRSLARCKGSRPGPAGLCPQSLECGCPLLAAGFGFRRWSVPPTLPSSALLGEERAEQAVWGPVHKACKSVCAPKFLESRAPCLRAGP